VNIPQISSIKVACLLSVTLPLFALTTAAFAQVGSATPSDAREPGSVIVFPKFVRGSVTVDRAMVPATEIEIGVVCPKGATCAEHQQIKIRFHWVCPGSPDFGQKLICKENSFDVSVVEQEQVVFSPGGMPIARSNVISVPEPPCSMGYLIGWVIDPTDNRPVKFDGLIGHATVRENGAEISEYAAFLIRADPALPNFPADGSAIATGRDFFTGGATLIFDGGPGHYQVTARQLAADAEPQRVTAWPALGDTSLILFTLDVRSNQPNYPVVADLAFSDDKGILASTSREFVCWIQVRLSEVRGLTNAPERARQALIPSGRALKVPFSGISDTAGPVIVLALVEPSGARTPGGIAPGFVIGAKSGASPRATTFGPF
jgi:hypothetical protein